MLRTLFRLHIYLFVLQENILKWHFGRRASNEMSRANGSLTACGANDECGETVEILRCHSGWAEMLQVNVAWQTGLVFALRACIERTQIHVILSERNTKEEFSQSQFTVPMSVIKERRVKNNNSSRLDGEKWWWADRKTGGYILDECVLKAQMCHMSTWRIELMELNRASGWLMVLKQGFFHKRHSEEHRETTEGS